MPLTPAQLATLKANIQADPVLSAMPNTPDGAFDIAAAYNAEAAPAYWVWRTSVFESEITRQPSGDGTQWSWPAYIARSIQEQNAWARLFMGGQSGMNPSLSNVRQGLADIFSGSANSAPTQRTHLLAACRRKAKRGEKLFSVVGSGPGNTGANPRGDTTNPDVLTFEGDITSDDVQNARNLP